VQAERLLKDIAAIGRLADQGQSGAVKAAFEQLKAEFPQIGRFDLAIFADGEIAYASRRYNKAARSFEKVLDDYPESELRQPALSRLYQIGTRYLAGQVSMDLLIFRIKGYERGVQLLERVSQETGLQDPNGLGLRSAMAIARSYEQRKMYEEAYLKWSQIAAVWDTGQPGKEALLGMAQDKLASYKQHPPNRRHLYNIAHLAAARTYYQRLKSLWPEEASRLNIDQILQEIDQEVARRQLAVAQYYMRTGKRQAASLYLDMVVTDWPNTSAAQIARQLLAQKGLQDGGTRD
jgi:tetratricopeptide (TPR) repeat protein